MDPLADLSLDLVEASALVTRTDACGRIIYANRKFCEVSGWSHDEVLGRDHNIVSSGIHPKAFWKEMYRVTLQEGRIWNSVVTNRAKDGRLYHVDTYIKAERDEGGNLLGFASVRQDVTKFYEALAEVGRKNVYLEHAAKILRHDMHSGINIYIPRGVSSLVRRLPPEAIKQYKLESPIKLLRDGLTHTQRVYDGVREFTNLVREHKTLEVKPCNLRKILKDHLDGTAYEDQVVIDPLPKLPVNESLFCTAIDNLIRNGLKYNDSDTKFIKIFMLDELTLCIQDNGRGMTQEDFDKLSQPYTRRLDQAESGTGLGLSICVAILNEHGFCISCEKLQQGTMMKVRLKC
jgi:two-component system, chemotaxis family, sensor kinase Cph1